MENITEKCKKYIEEYNKIGLDNIAIVDDPINDEIFRGIIESVNQLIDKILKENNLDKILISMDRELLKQYDYYIKNVMPEEKINTQKTMIELAKHQLNVLIDGLCAKCNTNKSMLDKCKEYIKSYNSLDFVKFINSGKIEEPSSVIVNEQLRESHKLQSLTSRKMKFNNTTFDKDLQEIYKLIEKINKENGDMFNEFIKIDKEILTFFESKKPESENLIIRQETAFLMTSQLYMMLRVLCNICQKLDIFDNFKFDPDYKNLHIRYPHSVSLTSNIQSISTDSYRTNKIIYEKLTNKNPLEPNEQQNFYNILQSKIIRDDVDVQGENKPTVHLRDLFMEWLYKALINKLSNIELNKKRFIFCFFTDEKMKSFWDNFYSKYEDIKKEDINIMHEEFVIQQLKNVDKKIKTFFEPYVRERIKEEIATITKKNKEITANHEKQKDNKSKETIIQMKINAEKEKKENKNFGMLRDWEKQMKELQKSDETLLSEITNLQKELDELKEKEKYIENYVGNKINVEIKKIVSEKKKSLKVMLEEYYKYSTEKVTNMISEIEKIASILTCYKSDTNNEFDKLINIINNDNIVDNNRIEFYKRNEKFDFGSKGGYLENNDHLLHLKRLFYKLSKKIYLLSIHLKKIEKL